LQARFVAAAAAATAAVVVIVYSVTSDLSAKPYTTAEKQVQIAAEFMSFLR
jgi:hypothetical protein